MVWTGAHYICRDDHYTRSVGLVGDRRTTILDAAIEVVGATGIGGLTHRAVDARAGLPAGSTSNHFRTKDALLLGLVDRFGERELQAWERLVGEDVPLTPEELAGLLGRVAVEQARSLRALALTRYAILVEAAHRPLVQERLREAGARVDSYFARWLRAVGSSRAEEDFDLLANYLAGVVLHELAHPTRDFDPTDRITRLATALLKESS